MSGLPDVLAATSGFHDAALLRALAVLPRGVSSSARIRTHPVILREARGAVIYDIDGRPYTDFVLGMGPMLLGHGNARVLSAVSSQLSHGVLFGTHLAEIEFAERVRKLLPFAQKVSFLNSGSEGTHSAVRIARATTSRRLVVKFEGHYHGWLDPLFVNTQATPPAADSWRHPPVIAAAGDLPVPNDVLVCRWNSIDELRALFDEHAGEIAAIVMEPLPLNFGTMWPAPGYLSAVRELCTAEGALLIFDEVLTGFRVALGGASELLGVQPDIGVYAKAIASGFPLAVVAGTDAAMESITNGSLAPAGTYSGNPVALAAAHATLDVLAEAGPGLYSRLDALGSRLRDGIHAIATDLDAPLAANQIGSVVQVFWDPVVPVRTFADAMHSDREAVAAIAEELLAYGSFVSPRGLFLLCTEHEPAMVDRLLEGLRHSVRACLDGTLLTARRGAGAGA